MNSKVDKAQKQAEIDHKNQLQAITKEQRIMDNELERLQNLQKKQDRDLFILQNKGRVRVKPTSHILLQDLTGAIFEQDDEYLSDEDYLDADFC